MQHAKQEQSGSESGLQSPVSGLRKPLLVVNHDPGSEENRDRLVADLRPTADKIGAEILITGGLDISLLGDQALLISTLIDQTDAMRDLTATIQAMIYAMADQGGGDEQEPTSYLSGKRIK